METDKCKGKVVPKPDEVFFVVIITIVIIIVIVVLVAQWEQNSLLLQWLWCTCGWDTK